ncbi:hypothetical protein PL373_08190 [Tenacibaculum maritimum]|nr:hypothetical protein [Tenacibaculum maritimum]
MKKRILALVVLAVTILFSNEITAQKFAGLDKSCLVLKYGYRLKLNLR